MESKQIDIQEVKRLIHSAYDIAHTKNQSYTRQEAIQYDPLISTLYKALNILE